MEETLGKRIVYHRKRIKLTQDQLAEKLGITAQAVSKWENDQSCPDIVLLPRLAEVFGISTDELLGYEAPQKVHQAEIVDETTDDEQEGVHLQKGNWEFHWDSGRRDSIGFALWVLAVGILYLLSKILPWNLSLWDILWPTALIMFGIMGFWGDLSFFRLGCLLFGGYGLASKFGVLPLQTEKGMFWAALIVLFGISLLADAIKKPKKKVGFHSKDNKQRSDYQSDDESFTYRASFGETTVPVLVPNLTSGTIQVSFGEYTMDLTQANKIMPECHIDAACSFGELRLLIPKSCRLKPASSTTFAGFTTQGTPNENYTSEIHLDARVSFGEITVEYV